MWDPRGVRWPPHAFSADPHRDQGLPRLPQCGWTTLSVRRSAAWRLHAAIQHLDVAARSRPWPTASRLGSELPTPIPPTWSWCPWAVRRRSGDPRKQSRGERRLEALARGGHAESVCTALAAAPRALPLVKNLCGILRRYPTSGRNSPFLRGCHPWHIAEPCRTRSVGEQGDRTPGRSPPRGPSSRNPCRAGSWGSCSRSLQRSRTRQ